MFDENSALVKLWVKLVNNGLYTREDVPNIDNLRKIVFSILDKA